MVVVGGGARVHEEGDRLASARAEGEPSRPRFVPIFLAYQVPTLLVAVLGAQQQLVLALVAVPVAVVLLISSAVGYGLERRLRGPSSRGRTLLRHLSCPMLLLQPAIFAFANFSATFNMHGPNQFKADEFVESLAMLEGGAVGAVLLPLAIAVLASREAWRA